MSERGPVAPALTEHAAPERLVVARGLFTGPSARVIQRWATATQVQLKSAFDAGGPARRADPSTARLGPGSDTLRPAEYPVGRFVSRRVSRL
jgi:hypothetical protein